MKLDNWVKFMQLAISKEDIEEIEKDLNDSKKEVTISCEGEVRQGMSSLGVKNE